ncbi:hypothetical protein ACODT3_35075 [Streptomyces sp. 4.24]|uniref:hypothetical protein n=1 Tax=Streptomyces tritrimontium TaxID=3406573 RepID=UPI003BB6ADA8
MDSCRGPRTPLITAALIVASLALATGCVTVRPAGPGPWPAARPGAAATGVSAGVPADARTGRDPAPDHEARPLGPLPGFPASAPSPDAGAGAGADTAAGAVAPAAGTRPAPAARERSRAKPVPPGLRPERPRRARTVRPAPAPAPAPAAKARGSRPAPNRTYDMAPLCAAARGTVDPAIVALCR